MLGQPGATLICNGRYQEARDVYEDVDGLIAGYPAGVFPRVDYPRMNALLAEYRLGLVEIKDAVVRQRAIASAKADGDPFYVENALAVYLALAGRLDEALAIFDQLDKHLSQSRRDPEPSMMYLIAANRCVTRFLAGDVLAARRQWADLAALVDRIAYVVRPILVRRHELLVGVSTAIPPCRRRSTRPCSSGAEWSSAHSGRTRPWFPDAGG